MQTVIVESNEGRNERREDLQLLILVGKVWDEEKKEEEHARWGQEQYERKEEKEVDYEEWLTWKEGRKKGRKEGKVGVVSCEEWRVIWR